LNWSDACLRSTSCGPLTLPSEHIQALADTILKFGTDPALRSELGGRARRCVIEEYNWKRIAKLTEQAYRQ